MRPGFLYKLSIMTSHTTSSCHFDIVKGVQKTIPKYLYKFDLTKQNSDNNLKNK